MTIAAGFRFSDGLLLCADTQLTVTGYMKLHASKIVPVDFAGGSKAAFVITGSVAHAHMAVQHCSRALAAKRPEEMATADMILAIEDEIEGFHQDHIFSHPGFVRGELTVQMLIAIWSHVDSHLTLLATQDNAVTRVPDYACLGAGAFLANYLVPTIFRHSSMGLRDTANIAIHVLRETKSYVDSCGGSSQLLVLRRDGSFSDVAHVDITGGETISEGFREAIRRLFVVAADLDTTEEKLKEELEMTRLIIEGYRRERRSESNKLAGIIESLSKVREAHGMHGLTRL